MLTLHHARKLAGKLGPGLITGAADDDPSGLATYSQAGAQFGAGLLWTLALTTPLMIAIQMVSARIGWLTGRGLAANIRDLLPRWMTVSLVALLVFANTLNIAADIAAMGEALQLIVGGPEHGHALVFGALCTILPLWLSYESMVRVLKWLTLALLSYVAVVFMLHVDWDHVLVQTLIPNFEATGDYWMVVVAVLGTTISPYLFFWQASQEAEQRRQIDQDAAVAPLLRQGAFAREHLYRIKLDTVVGMVFSNAIAFCVMLTTAITLNQHGVTDVQTTRQAAEALRPLAGDFTFALFALGIIGTGMLAVPVLAGSAAYAVADAFEWRAGFDHDVMEAKGFFGVVAASTIIGTLVDFTPLDPIKALIWSAVANGVIAVPIMAVMMWLGSRVEVLGDFTLSRRHRVLGWLATAVMAAAVVGMLVSA
ncbi:MAG TPA: divalent metal cation transporter [Aromatoleum sp.]|uniref:NRAMP family divalent metal transporter n=1 Tax=Aromatoleum sp. TaxID=2307007 RepID=UPI002B4A8626|nr:divalent metal cation transporter [Aromatoleum sp.]HJV24351.1 divalent metal cation transporter [Aromatoleum sp.]